MRKSSGVLCAARKEQENIVRRCQGTGLAVDFWAMKARIRELLRAVPFQPFIIRMADGREYRIDHPDFVLAAASEVPQITIEERDGRQHYLSALLITSIEHAPGISAQAA
jgi:hypothetical protein